MYFEITPILVFLLIIIIITCENPKISYVCLPIYCIVLESILNLEIIDDTVNKKNIPDNAAIIMGIIGVILYVAMSRRKCNAITKETDIVSSIIYVRFI